MKRKRWISFLILLAVLCCGFTGWTAWDGYEEETGADSTLLLVDMNNLGMILNSGAAPSTEVTKTAQYSAHWNDTTTNTTLDFSENILRDWSDYGRIELWMYNERVVDTGLMFVVYCDPETTEGISTRQYKIMLDFTGWKKIVIPFGEMAISRGGQLSKVNYVQMWSTGWSVSAPSPDTDVYIDSIYLARDDVSSNFPPEAKERQEEMLKDIWGVYDGSSNAMIEGEVFSMGAKTKAEDGATMVPLAFFEQAGGQVISQGEGYKIRMGDHAFDITPGETYYTFDCLEREFSHAPYEENGTVYLPLEEAAEQLGLETAYFRYMTLVGKETVEDVVQDREVAELTACEIAYETIDPKDLTKEDFLLAKRQWKKQLVGDETLDLENEHIQKKLEQITRNGQRYVESLNRDSNRVNLWGDAAPATSAEMSSLYQSTLQMALAYGTYGSGLYQNESVKKDIIDCLDWMYDNVYGDNVLTGSGFLNGSGGNWWDWGIGTPQNLVNILVIMEEDLTKEQIQKYLAPVDIKAYLPSGTGANKMDYGYCSIGSALLQEDGERILKARDSLDNVYQYVEYSVTDVNGEGFYTDGSYIFHTKHPMTGAYGVGMLEAYANVISMLQGTAFAISSPLKDNYVDWIYEAFDPVMQKGGVMSMVSGRTIRMGASEGSHQLSVIEQMLRLLDAQRPEDKAKMESIIKYYVTYDTSKDYYLSLPISQIPALVRIMEDESITAREPREQAKVYHKMDRVVQHRDEEGYSAGLAMSSSRVYNYESITGYNTTGWYIGDGMLYVYDDEDLTQFDNSFWQTVNPYRMPGVTADTQERPAASIAQRNEYLSHQDFVGGAEMEGGFATAAMALESYHCDGSWGTSTEFAYPATNTGNAPIHDSSLTAKKSWFFFDDEIVALGADIDSYNGINVETTVENRKSKQTMVINADESAQRYDILSAVASAEPEPDNNAANSIDGDLNTRWAAEGPANVVFDLGEEKEIGYAALAFYNGIGRQTTFDLEISSDGQTWEKVYTGQSSGTTDELELVELGNVTGRYVRYTGYENTVSKWVSLSEMQVYSPSPVETFSLGDTKNIGMEQVSVDGQPWPVEYETQTKQQASYVHLEGTGGYYFPGGQTVMARKTNTSPSFFELWIDHGVDPENATYQYVLLPNRTVEETAAYASNPDIEILSNTEQLQAVRETKNNLTGMVFWSAGACEGIQVSAPMVVMIKEEGDTVSLSISDPTWKLAEASIQLPKEGWELKSADEGVSYDSATQALQIDFNQACGKTFTVIFNKK